MTYYNDNDPVSAAWLRELIRDGLIAAGEVDDRSIADVTPNDLRGFTQCHFFAGIGGWSRALRLAKWPDDRPVWTGSCPCQPFSAAGRKQGISDERHLWPQFLRLIRECSPAVVFGEQVASKDGRLWLAGVRNDLEGVGYRVGAADLCSAGIGAPNLRQRLYWVAHADHAERRPLDVDRQDGRDRQDCGRSEAHGEPRTCGEVRGLADTDGGQPRHGELQPSRQHRQQPKDGIPYYWVRYPSGEGAWAARGGLADTGRSGDERGVRSAEAHGPIGTDEGEAQQRERGGPHLGSGSLAGRLEHAPSLRWLEWRPESGWWRIIGGCSNGGLADTECLGRSLEIQHPRGGDEKTEVRQADVDGGGGPLGGVGDPYRAGSQGRHLGGNGTDKRSAGEAGVGFWDDCVLIPCADGKSRRIKPTIFPLAHGISGRVGLLRGAGNAINPILAAEFIQASEEAIIETGC